MYKRGGSPFREVEDGIPSKLNSDGVLEATPVSVTVDGVKVIYAGKEAPINPRLNQLWLDTN